MNADARSTNDIRLIAQGVVEQQARVCAVKQDNLDERLRALAETTQANGKLITELAKTVAVLATTVAPLPVAIKENSVQLGILRNSVTKLKGRPAVWAAIGSAVPVFAGLLYLWFSR